MTASSSSSSSAFSGYKFSPVTELPSQTEWEFTTTDTKTATTHYSAMQEDDTTDGDATMTMFPFEDSGETENLLSCLSRVATAVISPASSTDSGDVTNSNVVVFGPHNWMDDENDEYYHPNDDEETPRPQQQDAANDDLMARPLEDLFNNALYLENDDEENYLHQEQAAHHQRRNNHDTSMMMMIDDSQGFLAPLLNHVPEPNFVAGGVSTEHFNIGLPLEERYMVTLNKLEASMKRSMESRNCLTIQTSVTRQNYTRTSDSHNMRPGGLDGNGCVDDRATTIRELLSSITTSSNQVQKYVTSIAQHK